MLWCDVVTEPTCIEDTSEPECKDDSNPLPGELLSTLSAAGSTERSIMPSISLMFVSIVNKFSFGGGGGGVTRTGFFFHLMEFGPGGVVMLGVG